VLSALPPFAPEFHSSRSLISLTPAEQVTVQGVRADHASADHITPCGGVTDDRGLIVSYDINHQYAALRRIDFVSLGPSLAPAIACSPRVSQALQSDPRAGPGLIAQPDRRALRAYWWRASRINPHLAQAASTLPQGQFVCGNFGDLAAPHLLGRLVGITPRYHDDGPRLMSVGSTLQTARDGDVIWGAGFNGARPELVHAPRHLHVYATRGPISFDYLHRAGFDVSRVSNVFDPAILVGHLFADEIAKLRRHIGNPPRDFILIPHFSDDAVMRRLYPDYENHIRSADTPFFQMVSEILRSNLVISSSLHGIIVAEALGVPAIWHRPLMGEDELKFTDYYLGTGRYRIVRVESLQSAFRTSPMPLPSIDQDAILASFPSLADLEAHGVLVSPEPVVSGRMLSFAAGLPDSVRLVRGWSSPEPHGVWSDGKRADLEILIDDDATDDKVVELIMTGYVPAADRPQRIAVSDQTKTLGSFEIAVTKSVGLRLPLKNTAIDEGLLRLTFSIETAASPASLGRGDDTRQLGISLQTLRLRPCAWPSEYDAAPRLRHDGQEFMPVSADGQHYIFRLPAVAEDVRLLTRTLHPADGAIAALEVRVEDTRTLGLPVHQIVATRGKQSDVILAEDARLTDGWWGLEGADEKRWRWTNGDAALPIERGGPVIIDVEITQIPAYPVFGAAEP
jgi:pyruvyltransferase